MIIKRYFCHCHRTDNGAYRLFPSSPQPNILRVYCTYGQYNR